MELFWQSVPSMNMFFRVWSSVTHFIYKLLGEIDKDEKKMLELSYEDEEEANETNKKIGVVTALTHNIVTIDKKYQAFAGISNAKVGSVVKYVLPNNEITNFSSYDIEVVEEANSTQPSKAILYGKYFHMNDDKIILNEGTFFVGRDITEITFSPRKGDLVKLEYINAKFMRMTPKECKIVTTKVSEWNGLDGYIEPHIKIFKDVCHPFYMPAVGDNVVSCIILCDTDEYKWRSLKLQEEKSMVFKKKIFIENTPLLLVELGKEITVNIPITNVSLNVIGLVNVEVVPPSHDITVESTPLLLYPEMMVNIKLKCKGIEAGKRSFSLHYHFGKFKYAKSYFLFTINKKEEGSPDEIFCPHSLFVERKIYSKTFRFLRNKPKGYVIPETLREVLALYERDPSQSLIRMQEIVPSLQYGLCSNTYGNYLHTLVYLEELQRINVLSEVKSLSSFRKCGEFYVLDIEEELINSSLVPGDSAICSHIVSSNVIGKEFRVTIVKKTNTELFFAFKDVFNVINADMLFQITFEPNRKCMISMHHAIDEFIKNVGEKWIFPDTRTLSRHRNTLTVKPIINLYNKNLNAEQLNAVRDIIFEQNSLSYPYLIFGPPGTGKTTTLVEAILQIVKLKLDAKILIATPSNSALDWLCKVLITSGNFNKRNLIRLTSFLYTQQQKIPVDITEFYSVISNEEEVDHRISKCDIDHIGTHKVTLGTLSVLGVLNSLGLRKGHFTHIFLDEASQCTEPETLIVLAGINPGVTRVVLAGDPRQLGPMVTSMIAKHYGLGESMMGRLIELPLYEQCLNNVFPATVNTVTFLNRNYRALPNLVYITSELFYDNKLLPILSETVSKEASLFMKIKEKSNGIINSNLIIADVDGCESIGIGNRSYFNLQETVKVISVVNNLYNYGFNSDDIGILSPYAFQVKIISQFFDHVGVQKPKIGSVEEFQGCERNIIILSLVRTRTDRIRRHEKTEAAFISDPARINVALSRAKILVLIIAKKEIFDTTKILRALRDRAVIIN